jgi:hypothetical protein
MTRITAGFSIWGTSGARLETCQDDNPKDMHNKPVKCFRDMATRHRVPDHIDQTFRSKHEAYVRGFDNEHPSHTARAGKKGYLSDSVLVHTTAYYGGEGRLQSERR